jgi:prepilin-type N-terminal cleavage/methylation domain-containing protein
MNSQRFGQLRNVLQAAGFTLIEILMVLILLAILTRIGITQFTDYSKDAKTAVTQDSLAALKRAIIGDSRVYGDGQLIKPGYIANTGNVPTSLLNLVTQGSATTYDPLTKRGWRGPYVDNTAASWNKDAWGTDFNYNSTVRTIKSCGPDLTCGNSDDISVSF